MLDKQTVGLIFGVGVVIYLTVKFYNPYSGKKDRRQEARREGVKDRRVKQQGRRKANQLKHESKLTDRREQRSERRIGAKNRRHVRRRKADQVR